MKQVLVAIVALLALAAAIAAFAPASLLDTQVATISRGMVRISDAEGTLWRGRGVLTSPDGRWGVPVRWSVDPAPLLSGVMSIAFARPEHAPHGVDGHLEVRTGRAQAGALSVTVPGSIVTSLSGSMALQAGGDIEVRSEALMLAPTASSGSVTAQWRNARLIEAGLPALDLGTLAARLTTRGNALAGPVSNQGGAVRVSGELSIAADRIIADLRIVPDSTASPDVRKALERLGPADAGGAVSLRVDRIVR